MKEVWEYLTSTSRLKKNKKRSPAGTGDQGGFNPPILIEVSHSHCLTLFINLPAWISFINEIYRTCARDLSNAPSCHKSLVVEIIFVNNYSEGFFIIYRGLLFPNTFLWKNHSTLKCTFWLKRCIVIPAIFNFFEQKNKMKKFAGRKPKTLCPLLLTASNYSLTFITNSALSEIIIIWVVSD